MPLQIVKEDLTKINCDAIVNSTNRNFIPCGGLDLQIHQVAGPNLLSACFKLGEIGLGETKITPAYNLPCKYVIHTVGPRWLGGYSNERGILKGCYVSALETALKYGCKSIAFPLISSGLHGYPKDKVLKIAIHAINEFLQENEIDVYLAVYDKTSYEFSKILYGQVERYIDNCAKPRETAFFKERELSVKWKEYAPIKEEKPLPSENHSQSDRKEPTPKQEDSDTSFEWLSQLNSKEIAPNAEIRSAKTYHPKAYSMRKLGLSASKSVDSFKLEPQISSIKDVLENIDESFSVTLLKLIDIKGMTDVECYKKANVSKQTWYKILNEKNYKPSKNTIIAFAIALKLTYLETQNLLATVGFTLSRSSKFDMIIKFFLDRGVHDIMLINETLFEFDQPCLGCLA